MIQTHESTPAVSLRRATRTLLSAAFALSASAAMASPQPTSATAGVSFDSPAAGVTNITAPNNAIIDYASFNVGSGETVNFLQPGASARVLNRINSATPSQINGTINANGIVYFVNPSGVTFGPNSVVDAAGFYAAAGSLSNDDFLRGVDRFTDLGGAVHQRGVIRAESIAALVGREVINTGTISVPDGTAVIASGSEVYIGSPLGGVMVQLNVVPRTDNDGGAVNDGTIDAKEVSLVAGDMFALALTAEAAVEVVTGPVTIERADTDGDGDIDFDDIDTAFANYTTALAPNTGGKVQADGDTDGDGDVDDADIGNLYVLYTGPINPPVTPPTTSPAPPAAEFDLSSADDIGLLPPIETAINLNEADLGILRNQLGIALRQPSAQERIQDTQARALYNDLNPTGDRAANPDGSYTIVNTRVDADVVEQALAIYRERLLVDGVSPAERAAQIRTATATTLAAYNAQANNNDAFDADAFAAYLAENNAELLDDLGALERLRQLTLTMGLSEREKLNSDRLIIERARPESLSFEQMKATIASAASLTQAAVEGGTEADAG